MSSICKVIKFRSIIEALTDTEFDTFISHFRRQCGRNALLVVGSPFNFKNNTLSHNVEIAINIVETIIRSRKKSINISSSNNKKLDTLPCAIIGEIGSYLRQRDHIRLSKCSRSVYIGCNDPNTLRQLNLLQTQNYCPINLEKYLQIENSQLIIIRI